MKSEQKDQEKQSFGKSLPKKQAPPHPLQAFLQQAVGGILVLDSHGKTLFANEVAQRLIAGRVCYPNGTEIPPNEQVSSRASRGETVACQEQRIVYLDGSYHDVVASGAPLLDDSQAVVGAILTFLDVSEQQQEERTLFEAAVIQHTDEPIVGRKLDGTIVAWNRSAERVYGYAAEEALGQPISMLFTPGFEDEQERLIGALQEGQQFVSLETRRRHKDGRILDIALTASPVRNMHGTVIGLLAISHDITAQKRTERALRVTHNRLQSIVESDVIGMTISDVDGYIFEANDYYLDMLGYTRADFNAGVVNWRAITVPEYLHLDDNAIVELMQRGVCEPYEKEYVCKDGRRIWVLLVDALLREEDNRIIAFVLDISAQKQADETIHAQANLLEQTQDAILVWDWGDRIVNWYNGAARLYGWSRSEAIGKNAHQLLHTTSPLSWAEIEETIRTVGEWSGELTQVTKNGRQVIVESHMKRVSYGRDQQHILEVNHDVTERKWVEQIAAQTYAKVLDQRRKQKAILGALPVGVAIADEHGRITEVNDQFKKIWGPAPQVNGIDQYGVFKGSHPDTGEPIPAEEWTLARAIRTGEVTTGEVIDIERFGDGQQATILNSAAPIRNDQGEIVGGVLVMTDITERKQMEQALRESEERLRTVLENMPVMMVAMDEQDLFLRWNRECERVTGYSAGEIVGNPQALALLMPDPAYREKTLSELVAFGSNYRHYETMYTAKDGTSRTISWSNISRRFPVPGWNTWAVGIDVTERKLSEQQQLELRAQRERVQILTDFVRDISHDFKTPISTINTSLYLMQRLTDPAKRESHVGVIHRQVTRLNDLMEGLLTMTRLDDTSGIKTHRVGINQIVSDIGTRIWDMAAQKDIHLQIELDSDDIPVLIDESEMGKALIELAENAVQFTLERGVVALRTRRQDNHAVIEVYDTGIGIPESDLPKIFERLYRVDKARATDTGGIGMGLAIAQKIVQLHGGTIEVNSTLGRGSTFRVLLPIAAEPT